MVCIVFKHDKNKVIEKCANFLAERFGFNPCLVIQSFHLFPMDFFVNTPKVPVEEIEDWYYLRDSGTHASLVFNYVTGEYILINEKDDWNDQFFEEMTQTTEELQKNYELYVDEMNQIINSEFYQEVEVLIKDYLDLRISERVRGTPIEYVQKLMSQSSSQKTEGDNCELVHKVLSAFYYKQGLK
ncbi:hypothetical protein ES705_28877 [subsurface metagenome]